MSSTQHGWNIFFITYLYNSHGGGDKPAIPGSIRVAESEILKIYFTFQVCLSIICNFNFPNTKTQREQIKKDMDQRAVWWRVG